ncbi:MAG: molybdenum cofactor guanylyltransferase MobA [Campylobacterales bacterium]|nr:molybdenum cofactor guanylyltransferase MobA [Campylobacterales bacterium]
MIGVLFAGGKSSRMGSNKALLPFGGYPTLAEFQLRRLEEIFEAVYISVKNADTLPFTCKQILDPPHADFAPTAGFIAAFEALHVSRFFALSVDTPFVGVDEIMRLIEADEESLDAVIARTPQGTHPLCGIYHRSLAPHFVRMAQEHDHRLGKLLSCVHTRYVDFADEAPFANLNHPYEYDAALQRMLINKQP